MFRALCVCWNKGRGWGVEGGSPVEVQLCRPLVLSSLPCKSLSTAQLNFETFGEVDSASLCFYIRIFIRK